MPLRTIRLWQVPSTVLEKSDVIINVGVSGPGVVKRALEKVRGQSFDDSSRNGQGKLPLKSLVSVNWLVNWPVRDWVWILVLWT